jgi:hypothetical protein
MWLKPIILAKKKDMEVKGFDKRYFCDKDGNIYSSNYKNTGKVKIIKPAKDKKGYLRTMLLAEDGSYKTVKVHRIIALAFIDNENDYPQVNHKNGIKTDNRVDNLEWCNNQQNVLHSYKNGLQVCKNGLDHHRNLSKKINVEELMSAYKELKQFNLVANKFGVDRHAVSRLIKLVKNEVN